jgi:hypothetical protein
MNHLQTTRLIGAYLNEKICIDLVKLILQFLHCGSLSKCLLQIGKRIDVLDTCLHWYSAIVLDFQVKSIFIHYEGWSSRWDEWIEFDSSGYSSRIAPLYTFAAINCKNYTLNAPLNSPSYIYHDCIMHQKGIENQDVRQMYTDGSSLYQTGIENQDVTFEITKSILNHHQCYCQISQGYNLMLQSLNKYYKYQI